MFCRDCEGISRCIFAYKTSGKLLIFNKSVTEGRFNTVWNEIKAISNGWYPNFTNAEKLRMLSKGWKWEATPVDGIEEVTNKEAYAGMPQELIKYIKAMPEYDAGIFKAITD